MSGWPVGGDADTARAQWDEQVPPMVSLLRDSVEWYRTCSNELSLRPTRSSPAGKDMADPHWGERADVHSPIHWGLTAVHYRMVAAGDYVEGLGSVLEHWPPHRFAPLPLARGAIETCARILWMLAPDIDRPIRARRMLAERIAEERWVVKVGGGTDGLAQVQEVADALGIQLTHNDKGLPWGIHGIPYPTLESIVPDVVASSASGRRRLLWYELAGITHGSPLAVHAAMTTRSAGEGSDYDAVLKVTTKDLAVLTTTVTGVLVHTADVLGRRTGWTPHRIFRQGREGLAAASAALVRRHLTPRLDI